MGKALGAILFIGGFFVALIPVVGAEYMSPLAFKGSIGFLPLGIGFMFIGLLAGGKDTE
jgi:hypothetical protein